MVNATQSRICAQSIQRWKSADMSLIEDPAYIIRDQEKATNKST